MSAGRCEVRAIRANATDMCAHAGNDLNWNALKDHLVGDDDFGNVTLLFIKMRAAYLIEVQSNPLRFHCSAVVYVLFLSRLHPHFRLKPAYGT